MDKQDKNVHKGHRKRMKRSFLNSNPDAFETHKLLEMLLFYSVPQKDTNPLAHELIDTFGSLDAVLGADYDSLSEISGVKENTAVLFKLINAVNRRRELEAANNSKIKAEFQSIGEYLVRLYSAARSESVYVLLFDNSRCMIHAQSVYDGSVNSALVDMRKIARLALIKNASYIALAHNHPNGVAIPSSDDTYTTRAFVNLFRSLGIEVVDHFIVAGNSFYGIVSGECGTAMQNEN